MNDDWHQWQQKLARQQQLLSSGLFLYHLEHLQIQYHLQNCMMDYSDKDYHPDEENKSYAIISLLSCNLETTLIHLQMVFSQMLG